jgi:hypothetical protein
MEMIKKQWLDIQQKVGEVAISIGTKLMPAVEKLLGAIDKLLGDPLFMAMAEFMMAQSAQDRIAAFAKLTVAGALKATALKNPPAPFVGPTKPMMGAGAGLGGGDEDADTKTKKAVEKIKEATEKQIFYAKLGTEKEDALREAARQNRILNDQTMYDKLSEMGKNFDEISKQLIDEEIEYEKVRQQERIDSAQQMFATVTDLAKTFGGALGSMFEGGADSVKNALKQIGNAVITLVEGLLAAAAAAAAAKGVLSWGFSSLEDIPLLAAALAGLEAARGFINSLASGTVNVPQDQLAQIHKGEMVIPQSFSESIRRGDITLSGGSQGGPSKKYKFTSPQTMNVKATVSISSFQKASTLARFNEGAGVLS